MTARESIAAWLKLPQSATVDRVIRAALEIVDAEHWKMRGFYCCCKDDLADAPEPWPCPRAQDHEERIWAAIQGESK